MRTLYKRLLPVVLLPFARDATSAYTVNWIPRTSCTSSQNRHNRYESNDRSHRTLQLCDHIPTSKPRSGNEFICEWVHAMITTVRRHWLLSSPYITHLVNYAVAEDANRAMGLFGLVLCLPSLHGGYAQERGRNDWSAQVTCVRWAELNQVAEWSYSTLLAASQLNRRAEIVEYREQSRIGLAL